VIKTFIFKFLISLFFVMCASPVFAKTFMSLTPVATEIIYALGAEDKLLGVSSACDYPQDVKNKKIVGDTYFVNMEYIVRTKPDYMLAMQSAKPMLGELSLTKTEPVYFDFSTVEDIYSAIFKISDLLNKKSEELQGDNIYYVLISLNELECPEYYIIESNLVAKSVTEGYKLWIQHDGKNGKPKETPMRKFTFNSSKYDNILCLKAEDFKDNWKKLK